MGKVTLIVAVVMVVMAVGLDQASGQQQGGNVAPAEQAASGTATDWNIVRIDGIACKIQFGARVVCPNGVEKACTKGSPYGAFLCTVRSASDEMVKISKK